MFRLLCLLLLAHAAVAQPYLDLASVRYSRGFDAGLVRRNQQQNSFYYTNAQVQVPIQFKDSSLLLVNPIFERWWINLPVAPSLPEKVEGKVLFTAFIKPWTPRLTTTIALIPRWNGQGVKGSDKFQMGGLFLATLTRKPGLKYKMGLYYNHEFFGNFVVPVLGIEYRIKPGLQLFGNLPGSLTLEKKVNSRFYYGASFRAITNSYRYQNNGGTPLRFIRIDENQLQGFADWYLSRQLVLTSEFGHSFFRRFRLGQEGGQSKYDVQEKFNDGVVARLALAYRLRFD
ncbi:hypothetical protein SAMN05444008_11797 [Cnuella takakiae]|uniref:Outer membrane protein beta-barrel domain-containing protein n=1 Tax=Cnuella takakiae TaxID=1302690 RepID=A0A1M5GXK7_9BACT|nr:hypothetical protein [Cnuella takakiae]OLY90854.1 hypothetical protein BUE76_02300 [Cnuella takakiae]SHG08355.1 hypothetical protein SAMN05444008_11797 [Cnuella takakiae]